MEKSLPVLLLIVLSGCSSDAPLQQQVDETKAAGVAQQALADWIAENKGSDAKQIQGAILDSISVEGDVIHVILVNDNSNADGAMHFAYFNVYLDLDYQVVKVERGPDMIE